jgi:hypothetical protein
MDKYRDKKVVGVFVRFRAPLHHAVNCSVLCLGNGMKSAMKGMIHFWDLTVYCQV